jgi:hypothetical protein
MIACDPFAVDIDAGYKVADTQPDVYGADNEGCLDVGGLRCNVCANPSFLQRPMQILYPVFRCSCCLGETDIRARVLIISRQCRLLCLTILQGV